MAEVQRKIPGLAELAQNQKVFAEIESNLDREHHGKFALFSKGKFIDVVNTREEGTKRGYSDCGGVFSLHEIGNEVADNQQTGSAIPCTLEELEEEGLV